MSTKEAPKNYNKIIWELNKSNNYYRLQNQELKDRLKASELIYNLADGLINEIESNRPEPEHREELIKRLKIAMGLYDVGMKMVESRNLHKKEEVI
jgi:hypothetical protein